MFIRFFRSISISSTALKNYSTHNESTLIKNISNIPNTIEINNEASTSPESDSVLEPLNEDISHISPHLKPTFNFAAYINKSETLQELLKLGVNLHKIEKKVEAIPFILGLKFEDIRDHIIFLRELGLQTEVIADTISKNPLILKEDVENLRVRINYLQYKKFTDEMILRILEKNPHWLTFSTQEIDERLGFFQNYFQLSGNEIRLLATKAPKVITYSIDKIKLNAFVLKEEMGFIQDELKEMILGRPNILSKGQRTLLESFEYLHKMMNIPLERIVQTPQILTCRKKRLMERHMFLLKLDKAQYDPKNPIM